MKKESTLTLLDRVDIHNRIVFLYRNSEGFIEGWFQKPKASVMGGAELNRIITSEKNEVAACAFIHVTLQAKPRIKKEELPLIPFLNLQYKNRTIPNRTILKQGIRKKKE